MNLFATALVMGILFMPSAPATTPAADNPAPQAITAAAGDEEPSPSRKVATAKSPATASYTVTLTGYNAVPSQTDADPGTTASGLPSNHEVIAARSVDLADALPFGTVVKITREGSDTPRCGFHQIEDQIGYRVIGDTMNARWTNRMDVELDESDTVTVGGREVNPGIALGVCSTVKVEVVGHLPLSRVPKTQAELAKLYSSRELALAK